MVKKTKNGISNVLAILNPEVTEHNINLTDNKKLYNLL